MDDFNTVHTSGNTYALRNARALYALLFITLVFLILPGSAYAQRSAFLNLSNNNPLDPDSTSIFEHNMNPGETVWIDVWVDLKTSTDVSGVGIYIKFDNSVFQVIDQDKGTPQIEPFLDGGYSKFDQIDVNRAESAGVIVLGANVNPSRTITGLRRVSRFQLRAIGLAVQSPIRIVYEPLNNRMSRMFLKDDTSREFDVLKGMNITVAGSGLAGLPDVLMEPGESLVNYLDLDDYLINPPNDLSTLIYQAFLPDDRVSILINAQHQITINTQSDFTGFRNARIRVEDAFGVADEDTMRVIVSYRPENQRGYCFADNHERGHSVHRKPRFTCHRSG